MRIEGGTELGRRVQEGHWMGVDDESKGVWIYWPDTKTITVERNIYYNDLSVSHSKGEQDTLVVPKTDLLLGQLWTAGLD